MLKVSTSKMHVEKSISITGIGFFILFHLTKCYDRESKPDFLIIECTNQPISHTNKGELFNLGNQKIQTQVTPPLAQLIDWWVLSSLCNGVTTPQKQIFTGFGSSLDLQRMRLKVSAHYGHPFISKQCVLSI